MSHRGRRSSRRRTVGCLLGLAALASAAAGCDESSRPGLTATALVRQGWIGVHVEGGAPRSRLSVREGGAKLAEIGLDAQGAGTAARVARWRCAPRVRRLAVEDGSGVATTVSASTPSCAHRVSVAITPRRPHAGARAVVELRDGWGAGGLRVGVCLLAPAATRSCTPVRVGRRAARLRLRAPRPGRWTLRVRGDGVAVDSRLRIAPSGTRLRLLAAGDSLVAPVARALGQRLGGRGGALVRADVHYGAGLSTPWTLNWQAHASATARGWRPDVVVLLLGGGDAYPFGSNPCCGAAWSRAYALRARDVARRYLRNGAAQVYWLTLPAARDPEKAGIWQIANLARDQGLGDLDPWVRQIDLSAVLSPGFVFRRTMVVKGRPTVIRAADGVHLTRAGGRLAASRAIAALRRDAVLP